MVRSIPSALSSSEKISDIKQEGLSASRIPDKSEVITPILSKIRKEIDMLENGERINADIEVFVALNEGVLGISEKEVAWAVKAINEEYAFFFESSVYRSIEEVKVSELKDFLNESRGAKQKKKREGENIKTEEKSGVYEMERKKYRNEKEKYRNEKEKYRDDGEESKEEGGNYVDFIRKKQREGLSSKVIIDLLRDSKKLGFELSENAKDRLEKFRKLLALDLGNDAGVVDQMVGQALSGEQGFDLVVQRIYESSVSEETKGLISERFNVPYASSDVEFRDGVVEHQEKIKKQEAVVADLQKEERRLEGRLEGLDESISELEAKQSRGEVLTEQEQAMLVAQKQEKEELEERLEETQIQRDEMEDGLKEIEREDGLPVVYLRGLRGVIDGDEVVFRRGFGTFSVPLDEMRYGLFGGDNVDRGLDAFLVHDRFDQKGLGFLFSSENRESFLIPFLEALGLNKPGSLLRLSDLDRVSDSLKMFSPDPYKLSTNQELMEQNLVNQGLLSTSGVLDMGAWQRAMTYLAINKDSGVSYEGGRGFLRSDDEGGKGREQRVENNREERTG